MKNYFVYILTNIKKNVLYIGVTNNLSRRISQHYFDSQTSKKSFAGKYNCYHLVYYEVYNTPNVAIKREKQLKGWTRIKKDKLIRVKNPNLDFLNNDVF